MQDDSSPIDVGVSANVLKIRRWAWAIAFIWTILVAGSFSLYYRMNERMLLEVARAKALAVFEEDRLFRRWVSRQGGVYVPVNSDLAPNPLLSHVLERDITAPSGKHLTLMNSAYLARKVFESAEVDRGSGRSHITSLNPIRPENRPDPWEEKALREFEEKGTKEVSETLVVDGRTYMRLLKASFTEQACLQCHAAQGYKVGQIRGGVGVTVPISDIADAMHPSVTGGAVTHGLLWVLGLFVLATGIRTLTGSVSGLETALARVKRLEGIIPICMYCRQVRDDRESWRNLEMYVMRHSDALFSHGICPSCLEKHADELKI